jgi:putative ABC transport system permease protein
METMNLALSSVLRNRMRSFLTILGIVIGVMSVIILVGLVSGLKSFITDQIAALGPNVMFVIPGQVGGGRGPGGVQTNRLTLQDAHTLSTKLQGEAEVAAGIQKVTDTKYQNKTSTGTTVAGVEANYTKIIKSVKIAKGRFFTNSEADSGKRVAVVGPTLVDKLYNGGSPIGKQVQIGNLKYTVIGVMDKRGSNFGIDLDNFAIIPLITGQRQFGEDKVHNIIIAANNPEDVTVVQAKVKKILSQRLSTDDFTVQTQEQTLSTISTISSVLTTALGGIAAISLLVGGIGVMNIMLVSVTERTREIGLRKALGAKPNQIRNQFLIEAITLSGLGGVIGITIGILLSLLANQFIKTEVPLWSIGLSFGFSMLVGIIFGVAPAIRAAKLDPITALRYE